MPFRTGLFGGSFNPVHYGHLLLADEVLDALGLDRVLFVTAPAPPHKPSVQLAPATDRHAMVELAIAGHPKFAASDVELARAGPSYTVDTLAALGIPRDEAFLISGIAAHHDSAHRAASKTQRRDLHSRAPEIPHLHRCFALRYPHLDNANSCKIEAIVCRFFRKHGLHHASGHHDLARLQALPS